MSKEGKIREQARARADFADLARVALGGTIANRARVHALRDRGLVAYADCAPKPRHDGRARRVGPRRLALTERGELALALLRRAAETAA